MSKRRGVSPMLSVIILIGIAIVGGAFLGIKQNEVFSTALTRTSFDVVDLRLEKDFDGGCFFSVLLFNSGSELIGKTYAKTTLDNGNDLVFLIKGKNSDSIAPAETMYNFTHFVPNSEICGNFTMSKSYSFRFNGTAEHGSSFSTVIPVMVSMVERI